MKKRIPKEKIDTDKALEKHRQIVVREKMRRDLFLQNIADLVEMFETQEYKVILGFDPPPTWAAYLGLVETYYSRAQVERWRKIYYSLVKDLNLDISLLVEVPETRLEDIARIARSEKDALFMIEQAKTLTSLDWRNAVAEHEGKPTADECRHKNEIFEICSKCGTKHKIEAGQK